MFTTLLVLTTLVVAAADEPGDPVKPTIIEWRQLIQQLAEDSGSCSIPFSRAGNLILIRAKADSTEGNFILDTGAPGLVLNITYFRDYPVTTDHQEEQSGITGAVAAMKRTQVSKLSFACASSTLITADLVNLGHIENAKGVKIFGLIGLSLLKRFEMIIDYENNLIHLSRASKKKNEASENALLKDENAYHTIPFEYWNDKLVIRTVMAGKKLRFVIDTGAESNVLDSRLPDRIFENLEIVRRIKLTGAGSTKVDAVYGNLENMSIGDQSTGRMPFIITNLEKSCLSDASCIDGILGFDFLSLHKIGFNFVKNKMYIWK